MSPPLRLAVVGTLHPHSAMYQELLHHIPAVDVVAIYDDGGSVSESLRQAPRYDRLEDLLRRERFEVALVTVPNDQGVPVNTSLVEAGKHVLADKPVCRSAREMREIVQAVRRANVKFAVGYQRRFHPAHLRARDWVRSGRLGPVHAVQAHLITTDVASRGPDHFLFSRERSGGGILRWLGCHIIDLVRDLTGSELLDVEGLTGKRSGEPIDVEDVAGLTFRLENGALGSMVAAYAIPFDGASPYAQSPKDSGISVWGREAKVTYEPFGDRMEVVRYRASVGEPLTERHGPFALPAFPGYEGWLGKALVEDFIDSIRHDRPPRATEVDNLRVLEVIDAAYGADGGV